MPTDVGFCPLLSASLKIGHGVTSLPGLGEVFHYYITTHAHMPVRGKMHLALHGDFAGASSQFGGMEKRDLSGYFRITEAPAVNL
jgi:hypothetical protein